MPRELVPADPNTTLPKVIDESGQAVEAGDDYLEIVQIVTQMAQTAQLAQIRRSREREHFSGRVFSRTLNVTDSLGCVELLPEFPFAALATMQVHNYGPNTAYISINNSVDWFEVERGEDQRDKFSQADQRIEQVYYICDAGETARVKLIGKY